jgi:ribosome-binding ATPase
MSLSIGIVGLPNSGKSTVFNALIKDHRSESAKHPYSTTGTLQASALVPDSRVDSLVTLVKPKKTTYATVDFIDIAGLAKGADKGEGLGNQFLAAIRETPILLHVVRCFRDQDVPHIEGEVDPMRDIETIETELLLADIQTLDRRVERLTKQAKGDKDAASALKDTQALREHLNEGAPASSYKDADKDSFRLMFRELGLLTAKQIIYCANVGEDQLGQEDGDVAEVREHAQAAGASMVAISARLEEELIDMSPEEQEEYLSSFGAEESGLGQVLRACYESLGLISFLTAGPKEVRAWTIRRGSKAPQAAGAIHSDLERGFIRAEIINFEDYMANGTEAKCRTTGTLRVEGKDYEVKDGDVVHFLFNV